MAQAPEKHRPKFAHWLWLRGIGPSEAGEAVGCSAEWIRRITLPFDDADRARPSAGLRRRIASYTAGDVDLTDWEPVPAVAA